MHAINSWGTYGYRRRRAREGGPCHLSILACAVRTQADATPAMAASIASSSLEKAPPPALFTSCTAPRAAPPRESWMGTQSSACGGRRVAGWAA